MTDLARRSFLRTGAATGGGLLLSLTLPLTGGAQAAGDGPFAPNAFVRIGEDGRIVLVMPYVEMGQGTYTAIPMLIAEELEVTLNQVRLEHAPPDEKLYGNPLVAGVQATGGSTAIMASWQPLRQAGAIARTLLIAAAAKRWNVAPEACRAQAGEVLHPATGRSLKYGALAADAAKLPVPKEVALKDPKDFKIIGTPAKRLDAPAKVDGSAVYGIDARPPGVKIATLAQSPVFGGRVKSLDDAAAKAVKGVRQIVRLDDAVAVVADHMGAAKKGLAALKIDWDDGPHAKLTTDQIARELEQATLAAGAVAETIGDTAKALASAATKVEATYQLPFLAHAALEPMNCTVHVRKDGCDVWVGTQVAARAQAAAAKVAGLPLDKVVLHQHLIGGGFGRRLEIDGVTRATEIARHVDGPVKVVWTREEDIQHDMYRPYWFDRLQAGLDEKGRPVAWNHRFAGSSLPAGCRLASIRAWIRTVSTARSISPMDCPICMSNTCGSNRREFRPPSGAASARRTTSSWSKASWTNWPPPPSRTRSPIGSPSSKNRHAPKPCSNWQRPRPGGARRYLRVLVAVCRSSMYSAATWRRSRKSKLPRTARCGYGASWRRSIAASSSIPTR